MLMAVWWHGFLHGFPLSMGGEWMPCSVFFCAPFGGRRKLAGGHSSGGRKSNKSSL
jgi:hypothetical protein